MANSFSDLKNSRRSNFKKAQEQVQQVMNPKNSSRDERFWELSLDKAGNGEAIIRFLPAAPGEASPFVQTFSHAFQGVGGWYIEESLTTVGKPDPVAEMNSALYNAGQGDHLRENGRYRVTNYVTNIMVVSDPSKPENNGKVFLYRFGKKIFGMINDAMFPAEETDESGNLVQKEGIDVFSLWEGANFKLKAKTVKGFRSYDLSKFFPPKALSEDDAELEKVWHSQHKLQPFLDPENKDRFKSYEQLKARLIRVLGDEALDFFGKTAPGEMATAASKPTKQIQPKQATAVESEQPSVKLNLGTEDNEDEEDDLDDLPFDLDDDEEDDDLDFQDLVDK